MKIEFRDGRVMKNVPFIDDDCYGKYYLVGSECGPWITYALVRADSLESAIDAYVESDEGVDVRIPDEDRDDYIYLTMDGDTADENGNYSRTMSVADWKTYRPWESTEEKEAWAKHVDNAVRQKMEDGEGLEDYGHFTSGGTYYDNDHLHYMDVHGPDIKRIYLQEKDLKNLEVTDMSDEILDGFSRATFVCEWADAYESTGKSLAGTDLFDVAPDTPNEYIVWAETTIKTIENQLGFSLSVAFARACLVPAVHTWERQFDSDDAESFGHYLAMQYLGHGVAWSDSHPDLPFEYTMCGEGPNYFLSGEMPISDFECGRRENML